MAIAQGVFIRSSILTRLNEIEAKTVNRGGENKNKLSTNKSQQLGALLKEVNNSLSGLGKTEKDDVVDSLKRLENTLMTQGSSTASTNKKMAPITQFITAITMADKNQTQSSGLMGWATGGNNHASQYNNQ
ncbi:TPA: hypothetical protein PXQ99_001605 [Yersinia enterocolitica]|nr:hypothetical protein [Yersinia enterocolitica]